MYNRYVRNDHGVYTRIPEEEPRHSAADAHQQGFDGAGQHASPPPPEPPHREEDHRHGNKGSADTISAALRRLLERFHLEKIDSGDLLLLLLLFLLYREEADEELLFALGLLLIL